MNQQLIVIIFVYFNCYKRANIMLVFLLYLLMISVSTNSFYGAQEKNCLKNIYFTTANETTSYISMLILH